jgi:hypothetical protein
MQGDNTCASCAATSHRSAHQIWSFEQEVPDLATLEGEIGTVTGNTDFQALSLEISKLLSRGPKREVYQIL